MRPCLRIEAMARKKKSPRARAKAAQASKSARAQRGGRYAHESQAPKAWYKRLFRKRRSQKKRHKEPFGQRVRTWWRDTRTWIKQHRALLGKILLGIVLAFVAGLIYAFFIRDHVATERPVSAYPGTVIPYKAATDADGDGVDDQADILAGALAYVQTHPKYKSEYAAGGYPTDGTGVCTDVVAQAFKAAGYDLRELVNADITAHPDAYPQVSTPDKDIDFRRVANLHTWLQRHAQSLPTNPLYIDQWQGGDVVVFKDHIGIVSDRRNETGIPYVIHHEGVWQDNFEQDILGRRREIVGHYRYPGVAPAAQTAAAQ